jgi:hypothetical protein
MLTYEVTADVRPDLVAAYESYMRDTHIPDVLRTGCFRSASFGRAPGGRYRIRYVVADPAILQEYLALHAPALRAHMASTFPEGIAHDRETWIHLADWTEVDADA